MVLLEAFRARAGAERLITNATASDVRAGRDRCHRELFRRAGRADRFAVRGRAAIACDGINSGENPQKQFFPDEGEPRYSGVNNVARRDAMENRLLSWRQHGAGGLAVARQDGDLSDPPADSEGCSSSIGSPRRKRQLSQARLESRRPRFPTSSCVRRLAFRLARCPAFIRAADSVLEFPMVIRTRCRAGASPGDAACDAAHPDGAAWLERRGQAILVLQERLLRRCSKNTIRPRRFAVYEKQRLEATTRIVLTNRSNPPDAILREVFQRTNDQPFAAIATSSAATSLSRSPKAISGSRLFEGCLAPAVRAR